MDDLIKRLRGISGGLICSADDVQGPLKRQMMLQNAAAIGRAAAALTESQETIARQQALLDRALESNGDMQATIARLEAALREARDAAHSFAHDGYDGVWSETDFAGLTPLADAALSSPDTPG